MLRAVSLKVSFLNINNDEERSGSRGGAPQPHASVSNDGDTCLVIAATYHCSVVNFIVTLAGTDLAVTKACIWVCRKAVCFLEFSNIDRHSPTRLARTAR